MSKFVKLALILIIFSACSKFVKKDDLSILGPEGEKVAYKVELAVTNEELSRGLMNRKNLAQNSGMLFDLRTVKEPISMWMKDTLIPLDMVFIEKDGTIFWIYENAKPMSTTLILPPYNPAAVLELNAGDAKKFNIRVGDTVKHPWFDTPNTDVKTVAETDNQEIVSETPTEETSPVVEQTAKSEMNE